MRKPDDNFERVLFDLWEFRHRDVGHDVAEMVDMQDRARPSATRRPFGRSQRQPQMILDERPELGGRRAAGQMRGDRSKNIPAVKGLADRPAEILLAVM